MAQQLYHAADTTVAEIAAIFTVPRTTIYGHLTNGSAGARPRARKPPAPAAEHPASPTTARAARELKLRNRLVRQRNAMRALACPTCGNKPSDAHTRWRQRQDIATLWLHLDGDTVHEQRHCVACHHTRNPCSSSATTAPTARWSPGYPPAHRPSNGHQQSPDGCTTTVGALTPRPAATTTTDDTTTGVPSRSFFAPTTVPLLHLPETKPAAHHARACRTNGVSADASVSRSLGLVPPVV